MPVIQSVEIRNYTARGAGEDARHTLTPLPLYVSHSLTKDSTHNALMLVPRNHQTNHPYIPRLRISVEIAKIHWISVN